MMELAPQVNPVMGVHCSSKWRVVRPGPRPRANCQSLGQRNRSGGSRRPGVYLRGQGPASEDDDIASTWHWIQERAGLMHCLFTCPRVLT